MTLPNGYPLAWPDDWSRTPLEKRRTSNYKVTAAQARDDLEKELKLFGVRKLVISSMLPLRLDGRPLAGASEPKDPGVAAWWVDQKNGVVRVVACDRWKTVRENLRAVGLTVESMRTMERAGAAQALERMVESFAAGALPPPRPLWAEVLDIRAPFTPTVIDAAYRRLAKVRHPDHGGTNEEFHELQCARQDGLAWCAQQERERSNGAHA